MKEYNDHKICFIICANKEQYVKECLLYLSLLKIPKGYEIEVLTIWDAESITAGYNEGMNSSDAKYKVYLHQDLLIIEAGFIEKILKIFQSDSQIGMIGMIGVEKLPEDAVMWNGIRYGDLYRLEEILEHGIQGIERVVDNLKEVEVVDGMLIATSVDIQWREDILKGWDFYDVSQSLEFHRAGYKIVVPPQNPSWTVHVCGEPSFEHYEENRKVVLQNYPEIQG